MIAVFIDCWNGETVIFFTSLWQPKKLYSLLMWWLAKQIESCRHSLETRKISQQKGAMLRFMHLLLLQALADFSILSCGIGFLERCVLLPSSGMFLKFSDKWLKENWVGQEGPFNFGIWGSGEREKIFLRISITFQIGGKLIFFYNMWRLS